MILKQWTLLGTLEVVSLGAIAIGLVNVGSADADASSILLQRLLEFTPQMLASTYSRLGERYIHYEICLL